MNTIIVLLKSLGEVISVSFKLIGKVFGTLINPLWRWLCRILKVREDDVKRPLVALVCILVMGVSVVSIVLSRWQPPPRMSLKQFEAVGEVAAAETVRMLGGHGTVVVLAPAQGNHPMAALDMPLRAFQRALQHQPGLSLLATEVVTLVPSPPGEPIFSPLTADRFSQILEKYPHADAVVSFVGAPAIRDSDWNRLPARLPKVLVISMFGMMGLTPVLDGQVVTAAIVPRFQPMATNGVPSSTREWFDRYYMLVRPGIPASGSTG